MRTLVLGLLLFLGTHSIRIVADGWRTARVARLGENRWKGLYSLASALGLGLIVWGYGLARAEPVALWTPPRWTRHLAALLTLPAFILIAAAYVPGSRIKTALGHPMVAGVKVWAIAHLLSNGNLADALLFGASCSGPCSTFVRRAGATAPPAAPTGRARRRATGWSSPSARAPGRCSPASCTCG